MSMFRLSSRILWLIVFLALAIWGTAPSVGQAGELRQDLRLDILEDPEGLLSFEDVAFTAAADQFRPSGHKYNGGFGKPGHVWARIAVPARGADENDDSFLVFSPAILGDLQIYQPTSQGPSSPEDFSHLTTGTDHPYAERPVQGARLTVPVKLKDWPQQVFVRIKTKTAMALTATLIGENELVSSGMFSWFFNGGYFSACFIVAVINLAFWYWLRESYYLLYATFAFFLVPFGLWQTGLLFPLLPNIAHHVFVPLQSITFAALTSSGFLFAIKFLRVNLWSRSVYWIGLTLVYVIGPLYLVSAVLGQSHNTTVLLAASAALLSLYPLVAIIRRAFQGDSRARVYLLSFTPLNIAELMLLARGLGLMPNFPWISEAVQVGSAAHLVLMTFGLGYRIRRSELKRLDAERHALDIALRANEHASELVEQKTRELAAAKDRIEKALESEKLVTRQQLQFIDMISHEYRTPVAVLRTNIDLLKMVQKKKSPVPEIALTRMSGAVGRLTEIIEVGLTSERIAEGTFSLASKPLNLVSLANDALAVASNAFPGRQITFDPPPGEVDLIVAGDAAMLKTGIVNVLDNALKYSDPSAPVEILLSKEGEDTALLQVVDQGSGISEKDQPHLFDKYYRASEHGNKPGTGLGLYLVEKITKAHNGSISVESGPSGTTVAMRLPLDLTARDKTGPGPQK